MTRICVTGAGGFVAHHFLEHALSTRDWDIVATDSFRHRGKTDRIAQVLGGDPYGDDLSFASARYRAEVKRRPEPRRWRERVTVVTHDLTAPFSSQAADAIAGPDGLDYLVAYASESHVDRSLSDPVPFVQNNVAVALSTLELARQLQPRVVVLVSTDEVYGPEAGGIPHPEWDVILPSNPYAASKAAQEAIAISYWRSYGIPLIIVNCMNLIGERQDIEKYLPALISKTSQGEMVTVHGSPGNIGTRHYLHARNLADGICFLLGGQPPARFPASGSPDRYNIAGPDRISNLELAQMVAAITGKPLRYQFEDFHRTRPGHDPHYGLDGAKMAALGWKPPVPFRSSLEKTVRWTLDNPAWMK